MLVENFLLEVVSSPDDGRKADDVRGTRCSTRSSRHPLATRQVVQPPVLYHVENAGEIHERKKVAGTLKKSRTPPKKTKKLEKRKNHVCFRLLRTRLKLTNDLYDKVSQSCCTYAVTQCALSWLVFLLSDFCTLLN